MSLTIQKIFTYFIKFFLLIQPLFFIPVLKQNFSMQRLFLFFAFSIVVYLSFILKSISDKKLKYTNHYLIIPAVLTLISLCISQYFSVASWLSFWGLNTLQHTSFLFLLNFLIIIAVAPSLIKDIGFVKKMPLVLSSCIFIFNVLLLLGNFGILQTFFLSENAFTVLFLQTVAIASSVFLLNTSKDYPVLTFSQVMLCLSFLTTFLYFGIYSAIFSIFCLLISIVFLKNNNFDFKKYAVSIISFVLILVLCIALGLNTNNKFANYFQQTQDSLTILKSSLNARMFTGFGPSNYVFAFSKFANFNFFTQNNNYFANSFFVTSLIEKGVLFTGSFVLMFLVYFYNSRYTLNSVYTNYYKKYFVLLTLLTFIFLIFFNSSVLVLSFLAVFFIVTTGLQKEENKGFIKDKSLIVEPKEFKENQKYSASFLVSFLLLFPLLNPIENCRFP